MTNLNITKDDEYESDYDYLDDTENYEENNLTKLELKKTILQYQGSNKKIYLIDINKECFLSIFNFLKFKDMINLNKASKYTNNKFWEIQGHTGLFTILAYVSNIHLKSALGSCLYLPRKKKYSIQTTIIDSLLSIVFVNSRWPYLYNFIILYPASDDRTPPSTDIYSVNNQKIYNGRENIISKNKIKIIDINTILESGFKKEWEEYIIIVKGRLNINLTGLEIVEKKRKSKFFSKVILGKKNFSYVAWVHDNCIHKKNVNNLF